MTENLALGTAVISATVLLHTVGLIAVTHLMSFARVWFRLHKHEFGRTMAMIATVLALFIVHAVEIWLWALVYIAIGSLPDIESALYFSTTTFSTIGYGDIVLSSDWRLLGSLEGISGLLLIGWSTAYLVAASTRHGPLRVGEHFDAMRPLSAANTPAGDGDPFA
jgi:voltage-gated potassium channel Kch